jgi:hypothetical protein
MKPPKIMAESVRPPMQCTGISASWCPIHGDCTCRDECDRNDDDCPLHSAASTHGEVQVFETIWGPVEIDWE